MTSGVNGGSEERHCPYEVTNAPMFRREGKETSRKEEPSLMFCKAAQAGRRKRGGG